MKRSKSQAVYKILPEMWISDRDSHGNNVTALVKSWNYKKMEGIYDRFIESELKRQIRLFGMHGGDVSDYNLDEDSSSFSIVESACREGIPDIVAELSPLMYYCPDCHRATQFPSAKAVKEHCPICKAGKLKQLQLVYPCECGYASPIYIPKVKGINEYYYYPVEKQYGVFYYQGKNRVFKEFGIKCPNCGLMVQRDSASAGSNYKAFNANVINLIGDKIGAFYDKGEPARKIMISKWFGKITQEAFQKIIDNVETAFSEKTTKSSIQLEAEKQAKALLAAGLISESQYEATVQSLSRTSADNELSIENFVGACDEIFAKEKKESEENYNLWVNNFAFNLMQYETIKNSKSVISLNDAIERQIAVGFIDEPDEILDLHKKLGIRDMQASGDVEIVSCSYGFTRKFTDPHGAKKSLKLVSFNKDGDSDKTLAFGMKLETEGILFDIDRIKILDWLLKNKIIDESQMPDIENDEAVKKWFAQNVHGDRVSSFGEFGENDSITENVFKLLHSMAHAFIKTAGEMSGLSANSITELIFIDTCSIFIYSQSNQGQVLGSLSGMVESIYSRFLKRVYLDNRECVFDPICVDRDESACQGCLIIADSSCKFFNTNLGRKYLYSLELDEEKRTGFWEM